MQCPKCETKVQIGDRFCEECGAPLIADSIPSMVLKGCGKCGALGELIDAEGYCSLCGFRNAVRVSDRMEINIKPGLGGVSDRGLKHRSNEDYLACAEVSEKSASILVVCDGVSSSQSPELAAKLAAEEACEALITAIKKGEGQASLPEAMKQAIALAQVAVCAVPYQDAEDAPSTTIVAAIVQNELAIIGWLGDSRAYWISSQETRLLTQDHSWLNELLSSGKMTQEEALNSAKAHAITQWLGADIGNNVEPSLVSFKIPGSGYLLLCTDGLWNYAPEAEQIANLVHKGAGDEAIVISRRLVEFARSQGGRDNITVAVLSL